MQWNTHMIDKNSGQNVKQQQSPIKLVGHASPTGVVLVAKLYNNNGWRRALLLQKNTTLLKDIIFSVTPFTKKKYTVHRSPFTHSLTQIVTHSLTHSDILSLTQTVSHSLSQSLTHSLS